MYPGGSPGVPPAPDTLIPQPAGERLSEEKDLKRQQEPGLQRERGGKRASESVGEQQCSKKSF